MSTPSAPTYIIGHRNPDADAVCSAIAYAAFKSATGIEGCAAARCGNTNARIDAILNRLGLPLPVFVSDITPRIRDIMVADYIKASPDFTCAECLELIDAYDLRTLPVVNEAQQLSGFVSVFQLGDYFVPKITDPRAMRKVNTSINSVVRALKANVLFLRDGDNVEDMFVKIGAMDIRSFAKYTEVDAIPSDRTIVIVGDRWDIQQKSIQMGVRLVVVTGGLAVEDEVLDRAKKEGVSIVVSPFDSATTAWIIRAASSIDKMIDRSFLSFGPDERLIDIRRKVISNPSLAFAVTDDNGRLVGIFSKSNLLQPTKKNLILVDHNETVQAVPGADEANILEVIDHHRLGSFNTQQPILFINEPVGSTCTIIAGLFERQGLTPSPEIAGVMMGGIISDTLNLNSPTSTEKDSRLLAWLERASGISAGEFADLIFKSGSVVLSSSPKEVVRADYKPYEEENVRFSVSQVEELGFTNFRNKQDEISDALENIRKEERLYFAALLVTDINTQNSLLLIKGAPEFIERIGFQHAESGDTFEMPGIVSRKKQLLPFLTSILRSLNVDGALVSNR
jgi:manganese-dependent inorganic pyrophosphatase